MAKSKKTSGSKMPEPTTEATASPKKSKDLDDGPIRGEGREFKPARYRTSRGVIRKDN